MQENNRQRVRLLIQGQVQGVGFRVHTRAMARRRGLSGWVRNRSDGTVEAVFEGPADQVREAVQWCRKGPPSARIDQVRWQAEPARGENTPFQIRQIPY